MTTRIDSHTHIFTLRSILTREAIRVITQRIRDRGLPSFFVDAVENLLFEQYVKPDIFNERQLLTALLRKLSGIPSFRDEVGRLFPGDLLQIRLTEDFEALPASVLSKILTDFANAYEGGSRAKIILNVIQTLRRSMQPTITDVADDILAPMVTGNPGDDCVIVALMMDIHGPDETPYDLATYRGQIAGTTEAALQRPGRILPFFGVHPDRPGHLRALKTAVESGGFVGVKLYPSLGFAVDSPEMRRVYRYCMEADLPVLLHCGHGGFYRSKPLIDQCDPEQWTDVLADPEFAGLRVCFAHFGGWESLGKAFVHEANWPPGTPADGMWGKKIYDFMLRYPNVYTDLAKHVTMFDDPTDERTYFRTLAELLADPRIGPRILYGTDAWLLRLDMPYADYLARWQRASGPTWNPITIDGPRTFLGFHDDRALWRGNLLRFVDFVRANRTRVGQEPAPWLRHVIDEPFATGRDHPTWNFRRYAVRDSYQFLGNFLTARDRALGYRAHRLVQLNELTYYDPGDPTFIGKCRDMARRFIDFMDQRAPYAPGHSFGSAVDMFEDIFKNGDLTLGEVALAVDSVFAYPERLS